MKRSITYLELFEFEFYSNQYQEKQRQKHPVDESTTPTENKLVGKLKNFTKQIPKIREEYEDLVDDLQTQHCMVYVDGPKKGGMVIEESKTDDGIVSKKVFTPAGKKELKVAIKELLKQPVEVNCRIYIPEENDEIINGLTLSEKRVFSGFVIPEIFGKETLEDEE